MKIRPVSVIINTITEHTANIYDGNSRNKTTAVSRTTANPVAEKAMIKKHKSSFLPFFKLKQLHTTGIKAIVINGQANNP